MHSQPRIQLKRIPGGYAGTLRTVEHVIALIRQGAKDFHVRHAAIGIVRRRAVKAKDYLGEIRALFEWVQQQVRYTRDPLRVEVLHSARRMLELRAGDCDDMTILLGAMLEAIGHCVRIVLTGTDPRFPDRFTHIYLEALHGRRWIPLDATMPYSMGWSPRAPVKRVFELTGAGDPLGHCTDASGLDAGRERYRIFNRFYPGRVLKVPHSRAIPRVLVQLGDLVGLMYRCDKWQPGRPRTFVHFMETPPLLACDTAGTQLYVIGGKYRVTSRGIEG